MAGTKNHDFHILDPDYMPFLGSVSALTMTSGGAEGCGALLVIARVPGSGCAGP